MLLEIGRWLSVNGEAVYGTIPWKTFGEGPTRVVGGSFGDTKRDTFTAQDIRFTTRGNTLYAIVLDWPGDGKVTVKSLAEGSKLSKKRIEKVELLGSSARLRWKRDNQGLTIELPERKPCEHAFVIKIAPVDL